MIKIKDEIRRIYENLLEVLINKYQDDNEAFDKLLEFLAVDNCPPLLLHIGGNLEWFFIDLPLADKLIKAYDLPKIKSDRYDYLGDIFLENIIGEREAKSKGFYLTPQPIINLICELALGRTYEKVNILDPVAGTGRFLLTANEYAPNAMLFGVDTNIKALRIAFTNAAIHCVSMYLLNANSLEHEIDISTEEGRYNWRFANQWYSNIDRLKKMSPERVEEAKVMYQQLWYRKRR